MTFCSKCGKELPPNVEYCPFCGTKVSEGSISYRKTDSGGSNIQKIIAIFFGGLLLLTSFGLVFGGGFLIFGMDSLSQPDGFFVSRPVTLTVNSYAIIQSGIDIQMEGSTIWRPMMEDIVTIKITAINNVPLKSVFIGIASTSNVNSYLNNVEYSSLVQEPWVFDRWSEEKLPTFNLHPGGAPSQSPNNMNIWLNSASGLGNQTLDWTPQTGSYSVVLMNSDGAKGIDVNVQLGAKIPILRTIGIGLLAGGIILGLIGILIIYTFVLRKN
ncbi:zinc ribbon domain-containing protein [Candidatus Bathyarchaeota archaeon]|nr:zinc ribbon domain-containing protein [Candidatus Bathyarchaeota archaeon]